MEINNISNTYDMMQNSKAFSIDNKINNGKTIGNDKAREAAQDFEAFFLSQTFETMFNTIETDEMFGGGNAEKIFHSFLIDEYGKTMASNGGIGVADYVMNTILELQEAQTNNDENIKGVE